MKEGQVETVPYHQLLQGPSSGFTVSPVRGGGAFLGSGRRGRPAPGQI